MQPHQTVRECYCTGTILCLQYETQALSIDA